MLWFFQAINITLLAPSQVIACTLNPFVPFTPCFGTNLKSKSQEQTPRGVKRTTTLRNLLS